VGPRAGLDVVSKRKIPSPLRESNPDQPIAQPKVTMDLREIMWEDVGWIHLAQDRDQWLAVVNTVMNLWVP
jgi:hypothetical protein